MRRISVDGCPGLSLTECGAQGEKVVRKPLMKDPQWMGFPDLETECKLGDLTLKPSTIGPPEPRNPGIFSKDGKEFLIR